MTSDWEKQQSSSLYHTHTHIHTHIDKDSVRDERETLTQTTTLVRMCATWPHLQAGSLDGRGGKIR